MSQHIYVNNCKVMIPINSAKRNMVKGEYVERRVMLCSDHALQIKIRNY